MIGRVIARWQAAAACLALIAVSSSATLKSHALSTRHQIAASTDDPFRRLYDGYVHLAVKGDWAGAERYVEASLYASKTGVLKRQFRTAGLLLLYEACVAQGKKPQAIRIKKEVEKSSTPQSRRDARWTMRAVDIVFDLQHRFGPRTFDSEKFVSKDQQLANFMDLLSHDPVVVRKRAWSMLHTPVQLSGPGSTTYIMALTALVRIEGLAGNLPKSAKLAAAVKELSQIPIEDAETRYRRECLLQDMDYWLNRFGLAHRPSQAAYQPAPHPVFPPAVTAGDRARLGLSSNADSALTQYLELCKRTGADGCLILLRGHLVTEWYSDRYQGEPIDIYSSTKSISGLIAAIAEGDGKLDPDKRVGAYLKNWKGGLRDEVTVQDLLDMTSGLPDDSELFSHAIPLSENLDKNALGLRPLHERGNWAYSSYGVQLLDPILKQVLGRSVKDFARQRLFDPLGIPAESGYQTDSFGNTRLFSGAKFRGRDLIRIGAMLLDKGVWRGKQVVPKEWVESVAYDSNGPYSDLFYLDDYSRALPKKYRTHWIGMRGAYSNNCTIFPDLQMVVVRLQKNFWSWTEQDYDLKEPKAIATLAAAIDAEKSGP